ncbi:alpha/beta fold hydrolase [Pseudonocardia sp. TRM90224]|uniref:alpha/beta fold hydrolase n=1 Tax=Pseudonocardia sp. TRM90224 TaxID=2812678 RepID=UPI001E5670CC|nr:alpha/beta hydrolase [Pseudonocardia sp. TRM90224]
MTGAGTVVANGAELYHEVRGAGPTILFISGATGDAGQWDAVADLLSDDYTVLTYDRRGNSRSPRPPAWGSAPIGEQADDAAALLRALGLAPAIGYGSSQGAMVLTALVLRHPEVLSAAVFHEPPYAGALPAADEIRGGLQQLVGAAMAEGGPALATERFLRWVGGDAAFEAIDPATRSRMLGNGEVLFGMEIGGVSAYLPAQQELAAVRTCCVVAAGAEHRAADAPFHWFHDASRWLADRLGAPLVELSGGHLPQLTCPQALAAELRDLCEQMRAFRTRGQESHFPAL